MIQEIFSHISTGINVNFEEVAATFGAILCVFVILDRKNNLRSFRVMCIVTVAADFMDLTATFVTKSIDPGTPHAYFIVLLLNTINYCGFGCIAYSLFKYLRSYMRPTKGLHRANIAMNVVFYLYLAIHALNLVVPYIIDYDFRTGEFIRTPWSFIFGYGFPLLIVTMALVQMVQHNKEFTKRQQTTLTVSYIIVLIGVVVQAFINARVLIAHGTGVIAVIVAYFALESPDYRRMSELLKESQEAQKKIREAQRARDDLFTGMTHEIRTPLNAVIGIDQLILLEDKDPVVQVLARKIKKEGETVLSVVNSLLNQAAEQAGDQKNEGDTATPDLEGKKVLSIDDTPINLKIIEGLLGLTEAEVTSANSGHEGLEAMKNGHFDLVLIDHQMPVMDGMATMKKMRELDLKGNTPVIMVTGNDGEEYRKMYAEAGFDGYVTKPVRKDQLYAMINSLIKKGKEDA
ncbi:MAG: response regulator [Lachnospiraceae bacterium]|nr:response regulator [Lachnospiraceae bacterium]